MSDARQLEKTPESAPASEAQPAESGNGGNRSRRLKLMILTSLVLIGACLAAWFWFKSKIEITTDDAFIEAPIHQVSARIPGQVISVLPADNQLVQAGETLVILDDSVLRARIAKAEAQLALARNESSGDSAAVDAAAAVLSQAEARAAQADSELQRGEALLAKDVIPKERLEQLQTAAKVAAGQVAEARERVRKARSALVATTADGLPALVAQRSAELELARLDLSYARITAPVTGYVTRKSVEIGNNVQAGQPLLSIVQLDEPWILANYKERQLVHVEPGEKVLLTVDAYPGKEFSGRVDSIMAGTGSAFSLLPPENATGNYVKIVQRVPVKITIDPDSDPDHLLRVGMSVVPTIYTGRSLGDIIGHLNPFH